MSLKIVKPAEPEPKIAAKDVLGVAKKYVAMFEHNETLPPSGEAWDKAVDDEYKLAEGLVVALAKYYRSQAMVLLLAEEVADAISEGF